MDYKYSLEWLMIASSNLFSGRKSHKFKKIECPSKPAEIEFNTIISGTNKEFISDL